MGRLGKCRVFHAPPDLAVERFHHYLQELEVTKSMPNKGIADGRSTDDRQQKL
ncbi:hypothetical protein [Granulicella arctica]|uniref:hypothetical protein n=1 Tax=Granulicella arctica TaxID=940613 RepID=UPI0021E08A06|nr:hypothetical protein [Granulicella arctica]